MNIHARSTYCILCAHIHEISIVTTNVYPLAATLKNPARINDTKQKLYIYK